MRALICLMAIGYAGCVDDVYEVPESYRGWLRLELERPECKPSPKELGALVVRFGSDGRSCTSDRREPGLHRSRYYFVSQAGRHLVDASLIHQESVSEDGFCKYTEQTDAGSTGVEGTSCQQGPTRKSFQVFVGTLPEMRGPGLPRP